MKIADKDQVADFTQDNANNIDHKGAKTSTQKLYRIIWRWHFYAGIFCIPFIMLLAVSGAIYLFKPQIDAWIDQPFQQLSVTGQRATANQQIAAALSSLPGSEFVSYRLPEANTQAVIVTLKKHNGLHQVYVHPYSLDILKSSAVDQQFLQLVKTFHGELLAGNVGSLLVELAGCWAIVLIITGLYLWWPRSATGVAGVLYPRLRKGARTFWRDIHAVTGFWISLFTLFLLITGLPWALVWGSALKELRSAPDIHEHHQTPDWSQGRAEEKTALQATSSTIVDFKIDLSPALLASAQALHFAPPVELSPAKENASVWSVKSQHQNRPLRLDALIDNNTGTVLRVNEFSQKVLLDKAIGIGIAAHEGQLFGWLNQLLGLLTTAGLLLISVSGFILWRRRKPSSSLGAPPAFAHAHAGKIVTLIVFALAAFLPVLAISLLVLWVFEWLVVKRVEPLRNWLGLASQNG